MNNRRLINLSMEESDWKTREARLECPLRVFIQSQHEVMHVEITPATATADAA